MALHAPTGARPADIDTRIGPLQGFWRSTTLNGRRLYVVPRSYPEVHAADDDIE